MQYRVMVGKQEGNRRKYVVAMVSPRMMEVRHIRVGLSQVDAYRFALLLAQDDAAQIMEWGRNAPPTFK